MQKCIRMGISVLKIVICGGKLLVLWLQIVFYGFADVSPLTKFPNIKPTIYLPR